MRTDGHIYEAAADWHERAQDSALPALERMRLQSWLDADPRHARAYRSIARAWMQMDEVKLDPQVLAMRRASLAAVLRRRGARWYAAAAFVLALAGGVLATAMHWFGSPGADADRVFSTAVGERSSIMLDDGSTVVLNTDSRLTVVFSAKERRLKLLGGQAWFQVAPERARPFVVEARNQRILALGTAFDVRLEEGTDAVKVTLAEGRVSVQRVVALMGFSRNVDRPAELAAGEALLAPAEGHAIRQPANLAKVAGWRRGQIVFDDDTLGAAVEEVNRYSTSQIELADPSLASLRVSGVFSTGHSRSFIETVTAHYGLQVRQSADGRIVLAGAGH